MYGSFVAASKLEVQTWLITIAVLIGTGSPSLSNRSCWSVSECQRMGSSGFERKQGAPGRFDIGLT